MMRKKEGQAEATTERRRVSTRSLFPISIFLLPILLILPGCNLIGAVSYKLAGPEKVPAKFVPAKEPTLVLVENYAHETMARAHGETLANFLHEDLSTSDVFPLVSLETLRELREGRPDYSTMTIAAIVRATDAKQVLYVQLQSSDVNAAVGGVGLAGRASALVKLIDAGSGRTIWPEDLAEGYPVVAATPQGQHEAGSSLDVQQGMYRNLAEQIDHLFHKWTMPEKGPSSYGS